MNGELYKVNGMYGKEGTGMYRQMNWRGFIVIVVLILAIFLPVHFALKGRLNTQEERRSADNARLIQLEDLNQQLQRQLEIVGTSEYIAQSAIQKYNFVRDNDILFVIDNPDALNCYTEDEIRLLVKEMSN
jgi:cell division protein FtsB